MRFLVYFTLGLGAACAVGGYLWQGSGLLILGIICAVLCLTALVWRKHKPMKIASVILLGCTVGFFWFYGYDGLYLSVPRSVDGQTVNITVTATQYGYSTDYGAAVEGETVLAGKTYAVKAYVNEDASIIPGDTLQGEFRLRYTGVGGLEEATFHQGNGIFLLAYPKGNTAITSRNDNSARYFPAHLRQRLLQFLDSSFPEDTAPFVRALLLGDSSRLDYSTYTSLSVSGIRHVIAVSGLHVAMLFSLVYILAGKHRVLSAVLGIPVLVLFAATAGFTPSIVRACIMQVLMLLAMAAKKEYDAPTALSFAAAVMLLVNPLTVTSVSFQLSVGSMAGIFLFSAKIYERIHSWPWFAVKKKKSLKASLVHWLVGSVSVTLSAMTVTSPLAAAYFGSVSLIGIVTNLLVLWIITFIFCGTIFVCLLGFVLPGAAGVAAWVVSWPVRYVLTAAKLLSRVPMAAVFTQSPYIVGWLVFCYLLLFLFVISKEKRVALLSGCAALGLCLALLLSWVEPLIGSYRVTVLDVGQGQCVLLQSGGKTFMVDCGGDYEEDVADLAAQTLLSQGINRLDGLILTHFDTDHVGAAEMLLTRIPADTLYLSQDTDETGLTPILSGYCGSTVTVAEDLCLGWGDTTLTIFSAQPNSGNESSLCVLFHTEKCDILITGDRGTAGEQMLLGQTSLPQLDVLIAGHHGAASSTSAYLLMQTHPAVVAISVGEDNRYGHPAKSVLDRLDLFGCTVRRTDLEGTIIFRG